MLFFLHIDPDNYQLLGGKDANLPIPWQVLILGTVYILGM